MGPHQSELPETGNWRIFRTPVMTMTIVWAHMTIPSIPFSRVKYLLSLIWNNFFPVENFGTEFHLETLTSNGGRETGKMILTWGRELSFHRLWKHEARLRYVVDRFGSCSCLIWGSFWFSSALDLDPCRQFLMRMFFWQQSVGTFLFGVCKLFVFSWCHANYLVVRILRNARHSALESTP